MKFGDVGYGDDAEAKVLFLFRWTLFEESVLLDDGYPLNILTQPNATLVLASVNEDDDAWPEYGTAVSEKVEPIDG
jgi:hypothetical protein